jgi:hypothetical protein
MHPPPRSRDPKENIIMNQRIGLGVSACVTVLVLGGASACSDPRSVESGGAPASSPAPSGQTAPDALASAHAAYLSGDFIAVGERIKDVLLDPRSSARARENAYELLDKSYEVQNGSMPSTFKLPAGYEGLKLGVVRGMSPQGPFFRVFLYGRTRDVSHLTGLTVKRLPNETLLDKATKQGDFALRKDMPGFDTFVLETRLAAPPEDGVFSIRFELDDGTVSEGWLIGHSLTSSTSPELRSPASSASLSDPNPTVSWVPFRSPEYAPFEWRTISVWVSRDGGSKETWSFWKQAPGELGAVRVGETGEAPKTTLTPGDYWLNVTAGEGRMFGPVGVARESRTVLPFHVVQ